MLEEKWQEASITLCSDCSYSWCDLCQNRDVCGVIFEVHYRGAESDVKCLVLLPVTAELEVVCTVGSSVNLQQGVKNIVEEITWKATGIYSKSTHRTAERFDQSAQR